MPRYHSYMIFITTSTISYTQAVNNIIIFIRRKQKKINISAVLYYFLSHVPHNRQTIICFENYSTDFQFLHCYAYVREMTSPKKSKFVALRPLLAELWLKNELFFLPVGLFFFFKIYFLENYSTDFLAIKPCTAQSLNNKSERFFLDSKL